MRPIVDRRRSQRTGAAGAGAGVLLLILAGCASDSPAAAARRDQVLQDYRTAAGYLQHARFAEAKPLLEDAVLTLGGITSGDASARQARSYFRGESAKNFRGEPYERVMAYYYRGILYWMDGEPDNARACFRSAQIQDGDADSGQYRSDYVLLDYLDGLVTAKLGGDGSDALKRARGVARLGTPPPPYNPKANVLVFYETGQGPTKYAGGEHGEQLRFRPGSGRAVNAVIKAGNQTLKSPVYDDLSFQATTRGGRVMDHVLANKAVFKDTTGAFGDAAIVSGAILATQQGRRSNLDEIGAGLLVAGLIGKLVSAATTPAADTRQWDNLPNYLGFAALELPPGEHRLVVDFVDVAGRVTLTRDAAFTITPGARDTVLFFSDRN